MHIVAIYGWQKDEATVAGILAERLGILVYEARQKIAGGGPTVVAIFADVQQANALAALLSREGVPTLVIDREGTRKKIQPFHVRCFVLATESLRLESLSGELCVIDCATIEHLLVATSNASTQSSATVTERKFSLGKTLLAGGVPMTKNVTREEIVTSQVHGETLWLYAQGHGPAIFDWGALNYEGLGTAMQMSRDLNFVLLRNELRRLAPQAGYDDRLHKRAGLAHLLGPTLSPERDLDLAMEILRNSLRKERVKNSRPQE